jgi:exopolyphosphatase/pppGpp-phosphohydrolase
MSRMDTEAIAALAGMQAGRAPFAVAGCRLLRTAMVCLGQSSLTVSDRGLRFGLLYREYPRIRIS